MFSGNSIAELIEVLKKQFAPKAIFYNKHSNKIMMQLTWGHIKAVVYKTNNSVYVRIDDDFPKRAL